MTWATTHHYSWLRWTHTLQSPGTFNANGTLTAVHPVLTIYYQNNVKLLLNCVAQTNTNLLELELNDFETPVSRTVYLNSVANSVGFVAAAVSMPIGGCRARRSLVVDVDVSVATELTVL